MTQEKPKLGWITAGLLLGLVLASLDQSIISTAMPTIVKELDGLSLYSWVFTIYMLASTTTMPIYGKLADLFGRRNMYLVSLALFLAGSVLCGLAESMTQLVIYRAVQGLGAGALMPIAFTIIGDQFPLELRGKFMGLFSAVFALASIIGPMLGGLIAEHVHWGWIFFINLPLGLPAFFIMAFALKERKVEQKRYIDWYGAITFSAGIVCLLLALVLAGDSGSSAGHFTWSSPPIIGLFAAGIALVALFLWIETKVKEPLIPLHLFRNRTIAVSNIIGFFMSAGMFGAIVYIPLFVQGVVGVSPAIAGYILTPMMLAVVVSTTIGGRMMNKVTYRAILIPSLSLMAVGFMLFSQMTVETTKLEIIFYMIITGLGMGVVYPTIGTAAQNAVDFSNRGVATSSSQFFRSIGGTVGVSVLGSLLMQRMSTQIESLSSQMASLPADQLHKLTDPQVLLDAGTRASLPVDIVEGLQQAFSSSLDSVFLLGLLFVCVSLAASVLMGNARLLASAPTKSKASAQDTVTKS
ncbi:DHA2 family efflux MFS transporter permease subunit [Brevibacillus fluminis]|uniref:DHA2 family efflux MFS transporter permease subunit n=1 Tax=Brevibacillus fluminis TaxID=511487 RepID=A0A3M8DZY8_9BACL|nr:MDR family MFS transporter [Brevibacillus fluminis]RNB92557.1 DHA2 family efflux MFS transporter permease subunit [Brevibacillus fluminis]